MQADDSNSSLPVSLCTQITDPRDPYIQSVLYYVHHEPRGAKQKPKTKTGTAHRDDDNMVLMYRQ
jgi:hypothetical protein